MNFKVNDRLLVEDCGEEVEVFVTEVNGTVLYVDGPDFYASIEAEDVIKKL